MNIGPYTFEEYVEKVRVFHGYPAPGVVLGGIMVDVALRNMPEDGLFDAISETDKCLPDAIQLLTSCTIGNGWMRIINTGRYALCLYEKHSGEGVRVFIDPEKLKAFTELNNWFFSLKPRNEIDKERLMAEIKNSGDEILGIRHVSVDIKSLPSKEEYSYALCRICKESYLVNDEGICLACQGKAYIS
jgi:formylmethanofuran dehydrogenase subunit E